MRSSVALAVLGAILLEEVLREIRDVVLALAQGRQEDVDDVQPVVEILTEPALVHHVPKIAVGRGDDPHVDLDRFHSAETHELALLHHAQQLGLRVRRDVPDLIEEDAPLVREIAQALLRVNGTGERALHMTKQGRLEEVGRQVAGVHRYE